MVPSGGFRPVGAELIGGFFTLTIYLVITFGVYKVGQAVTELNEIKEILKDIRRNTDDSQPAAPAPTSAESLVRAIHAGSFTELSDDQPVATHSEPQH
jgi:hypothetical protein